MPLSQFCTNYSLGPKTPKKFKQNYYMNACVLRFVMINELKEMDLRLGEITGEMLLSDGHLWG